MPSLLARITAGSGAIRIRVIGLYGLLIFANIAAWLWAFALFRQHPLLLGAAFLAYGFGLRHAVDADHIAAIDNVTRKLVQAGQRPIATGFWFALGHSSVVILLTLAIAVGSTAVALHFDTIKSAGQITGTGISALFLFLVAAINGFVLIGICKALRIVRAGGDIGEDDFDLLLNHRGLLSRMFRPLFGLMSQSWHMLPLGFLFGLGFDTATEIGLLGISATHAGQGMNIWSIMVFPALFASGMALIDTSDGVLMLSAYDWAFINPARKLVYNLGITALSVIVAVAVGGIEVLSLIEHAFGGTSHVLNVLNDHFDGIGLSIAVAFILAWIIGVAAYRYARPGLNPVATVRR